MLYLPPGVPHFGTALDACLTFSIGMRAPSSAELLLEFAEFLAESLPASQRYADPDLSATREPAEIDAAALARVKRALPWMRFAGGDRSDQYPTPIAESDLRRYFGRFITRYRSAGDIAAPPRPPSPLVIAQRLAAGASILRHPFCRIAWTRVGRGAELFVDGESYSCTQSVARRLSNPAPLARADYAALGAPGRVLLQDLIACGRYALTPISRRRSS